MGPSAGLCLVFRLARALSEWCCAVRCTTVATATGRPRYLYQGSTCSCRLLLHHLPSLQRTSWHYRTAAAPHSPLPYTLTFVAVLLYIICCFLIVIRLPGAPRYVDAARCFNAVLLYIYRVKAAHRNSPQVGYQQRVWSACACAGAGGVNGSPIGRRLRGNSGWRSGSAHRVRQVVMRQYSLKSLHCAFVGCPKAPRLTGFFFKILMAALDMLAAY